MIKLGRGRSGANKEKITFGTKLFKKVNTEKHEILHERNTDKKKRSGIPGQYVSEALPYTTAAPEQPA